MFGSKFPNIQVKWRKNTAFGAHDAVCV